MESSLRLGLIGNPENRRVQDFQRAWNDLGFSPITVISYQDLLEQPSCLEHLAVDRLRIDSPGENEQIAHSLIQLGGGPENCPLEFGEIAYLGEYHYGYCQLLANIQASGIPCQNDPIEISVMFDKWASHQRFQAFGLPRPQSQLAPTELAALRDWMTERGAGRFFLKPLHGSSASGVCALQWRGQRQQLTAPLRIEGARLVNSLKVQQYRQSDEIAFILAKLLPQGMIIEQWIPKLCLTDGAVDLRVLVIAGQARHRVVRQSKHPMTNLHLGNQRGSELELIDHIGRDSYQKALDLAEQAASCFPATLSAGVDILIDQSGRSWIGEINAFGDLLPRLIDRGESAYQAVARQLQQMHNSGAQAAT